MAISQLAWAETDDTAIPERYAETMRLAAIDVGSNSVHMLIADVNRRGDIEVVDRAKEMVRLGRKSFITGRLTEESMELTVRSLSYFKRLLKDPPGKPDARGGDQRGAGGAESRGVY